MENIGTLRCKLFGHKFVFLEKIYNPERECRDTTLKKSDYCVRCGIKREELKENN